MSRENEKNNYQIAKEDADKVDELIISTLQQGRSFRVEAGAGSGKTYSLNRVIEWVQANKWNEYKRKNQNVICITYTNAAVDVIAERLTSNSFILPSTIHSFAWGAIKQYQSALMDMIAKDEKLWAKESDFSGITSIQYDRGYRYVSNGTHYLFHDDVIKLFAAMLDNAKFRRVFSDKYPLILIVEYQDSFQSIINRFIDHFISKGTGPQFGFFGDAWQTIYQSNNACGLIDHDNLVVIPKGSNFRSAPRIVEFLNSIRPELPQQSAVDEFEGEVVVVTCEDYTGERRTDRNFKEDLPADELRRRINAITAHIKASVPEEETIKTLMITHKVLAAQQGYEKLLDILQDGLRDKDDPFLLFFMETVEPVYKALQTSDMQLLFDALKKRYPITKKSEKLCWKALEQELAEVRGKRAADVLKTVIESNLIPIPPQVEGYYQLYCTTPELIYPNGVPIREFLELEYAQFLAAIDFLYPEAEFSTEHGVKGEEYDNIVFIISKGWNQYQFETYAPMINGSVPIPRGKEASFERNRNLFYVCCSIPKKRLVFFVSVPMTTAFHSFLSDLVGEENILTYGEYLGYA